MERIKYVQHCIDLHTGNSVLGSGFWVLGSGFWVLGSGFWVLGSGFWVLGSGFWYMLLANFAFLVRVNLISCSSSTSNFSHDSRSRFLGMWARHASPLPIGGLEDPTSAESQLKFNPFPSVKYVVPPLCLCAFVPLCLGAANSSFLIPNWPNGAPPLSTFLWRQRRLILSILSIHVNSFSSEL